MGGTQDNNTGKDRRENSGFGVDGSMYSGMADEDIAGLAMAEDEASEFLLKKYKNFVRAKARSYFLIGADKEDIVQEGMIGLYKAIRDYRKGRRHPSGLLRNYVSHGR
jgi:DNA-directed RNA polymerase specialized sigma24 family protein